MFVEQVVFPVQDNEGSCRLISIKFCFRQVECLITNKSDDDGDSESGPGYEYREFLKEFLPREAMRKRGLRCRPVNNNIRLLRQNDKVSKVSK